VAPRRAHVLIVGTSTRALAASAHRAGFAVSSCDAFGDLDQPPCETSIALRRDLGIPFGARAAERAARHLACDAVAYVANLENHPRVVRDLMRGRTLLGNPPDVLARVRDPFALERAFASRGVVTARVAARPSRAAAHWMVKPRASGGGRRVRLWRPGDPVRRGEYLQERIEGVCGSVVFAADGRRAVALAVSRQLAGEPEFGASGFQYCGSVLSRDDAALGSSVRDAAVALAVTVTEAFGLVGVNGVDFVVRDGVPVPIEVNPRYSASMELVERGLGLSIFALHERACRGELPAADPMLGRAAPAAVGKAILYARHAVVPTTSHRWLDAGDVGDVPRDGAPIARGAPVCTLFATGADFWECRAALGRRAAELESDLYGARQLPSPAAPAVARSRTPVPSLTGAT
jgi:predicted ATP-grasp superfamily ATP-dependent carboligase